ncbi:hypothetical protein MC378_13110 [Polaribacter sp. MSW13]|uniref:Transglutaminase-like domain-containing protein n=1 Tax=Polaribacter marinus TaxID=2916838 RepID=A0A9X2AK35_9FLAO|nr:transglutaminase domain-containing protein [Polaribacter marinus]MCI2230111.1 hypothetical protein [Polaribacter marinus]
MKSFTLLFIFVISINANSQISDFKNISLVKADNIATLNEGENLYNLPLLTHKLTIKLMTDVEKFRAIYTWICNNIKGDFTMHTKVRKQRKKLKKDSTTYLKWNKNYNKKMFKSLLKHQKTMCTGYAYLVKEMAKIANIECEIIDGYGKNISSNVDTLEMANHSWNAVRLNNKWYLCDATWSSGYIDEKGKFINDYNDGYFLTDPILFSKKHFPLKKKWLLTEKITSKNFTSAPLLYGEAYKYKIIPKNPTTMDFIATQNEEINFSFKTLKDIKSSKVALIFFNGNEEKNYKIYDLKKDKSNISFTNKFNKKGFYNVHLKLNNEIVITYNVKVIKP